MSLSTQSNISKPKTARKQSQRYQKKGRMQTSNCSNAVRRQLRWTSSKQKCTKNEHDTIKKSTSQTTKWNASHFQRSYSGKSLKLKPPPPPRSDCLPELNLIHFLSHSDRKLFPPPSVSAPPSLQWACWGNTEHADVDVPQRKLCPHPLWTESPAVYSRLFTLNSNTAGSTPYRHWSSQTKNGV